MCVIDWAMLLEYLKVLLGWPVVTALILAAFMYKFSGAIATKLSGLREVGYPGGAAKFDPITSQEAASGDTSANLELPKGDTSAPADNTDVDVNISERTRNLIEDTGAPPDFAAALKYVQSNPGPTIDQYIESTFRLHCEKTFSVIYGGQLLALEYILAKGPSASVPHTDLLSFIRVHAEKASASGQSPLTDSQFVGFLTRLYLIKDVGGSGNPSYRGTYTGQQFLVYIKETYPLGWNSRAL